MGWENLQTANEEYEKLENERDDLKTKNETLVEDLQKNKTEIEELRKELKEVKKVNYRLSMNTKEPVKTTEQLMKDLFLGGGK